MNKKYDTSRRDSYEHVLQFSTANDQSGQFGICELILSITCIYKDAMQVYLLGIARFSTII